MNINFTKSEVRILAEGGIELGAWLFMPDTPLKAVVSQVPIISGIEQILPYMMNVFIHHVGKEFI